MRAHGASDAGRLVLRPPRAVVAQSSVGLRAAAAAVLGVAIAVPLLTDGGFGDTSRLAFAALAGLALLLASAADPGIAAAAGRSIVVVSLVALAALTALSALWSPADPADVLRWALVVAGYASVTIAAAVVASDRAGLRAAAAAIATLATIAGIWGLIAVAIAEPPAALRIGGSWRPAGPFEYPPALALLAVAALPPLIVAMARARVVVAVPAAAGAVTAGSVVALSHSRLAALLAVAFLAVVALAPGEPGERRRRAVAATLVAALALLAYAVAGGLRSGGSQGPGYALGLGAVLGGGTAAWAAIWACWPATPAGRPTTAARGRPSPRRWIALTGVAVLAVMAGLAFSSDRSGAGVQPSSGFDHGRSELWRAAIDVGIDKPVLGAGGEAYLLASAGEQGRSPALYAHSLPLESFAELGVLGLALAGGILGGTVAAAWRVRRTEAGVLLGPAAVAFAVANLVDWSWHLAAAGAVWALALGALLGAAAKAPP